MISIIISIFALLLAGFSFYWIHWRKGYLVVSSPRSFSAAKIHDRLIIELPLSFYNTGSALIVVDNLILKIRQNDAETFLFFNNTRKRLGDKERQWATQIAVDGRKAVMSVYSFHAKSESFAFSTGKWDCYLLGKLSGKNSYEELSRFKLNVTQLNEYLITYDNYLDEYKKIVEQGSSEK